VLPNNTQGKIHNDRRRRTQLEHKVRWTMNVSTPTHTTWTRLTDLVSCHDPCRQRWQRTTTIFSTNQDWSGSVDEPPDVVLRPLQISNFRNFGTHLHQMW